MYTYDEAKIIESPIYAFLQKTGYKKIDIYDQALDLVKNRFN